MNTPRNQAQIRNYLCDLFLRVESADISVWMFCQEFETIFNFELDRHALSKVDEDIFERLFDSVVWYLPFPDERIQIPNYIDDAEVLRAVKMAISCLKKCEGQVWFCVRDRVSKDCTRRSGSQ